MQLSDLHKQVAAFPSPNALVSSIISDISRQHNENPPISTPDILIICGDIIYGNDSIGNFDDLLLNIKEQYSMANDFLSQLCDKLFDGEKEKIIIMPGNHDISWPHSQKSMERLPNYDSQFKILSSKPENNMRWCWKHHSYYIISDDQCYKERFLPFSEFYKNFCFVDYP